MLESFRRHPSEGKSSILTDTVLVVVCLSAETEVGNLHLELIIEPGNGEFLLSRFSRVHSHAVPSCQISVEIFSIVHVCESFGYLLTKVEKCSKSEIL